MADVLTLTQLKRLTQHKYQAEGKSVLEPPMIVFWNYLVNYIPLWVAPNLLTITGMLISMSATVLLIWFSPHARDPVPSWALIVYAIALFMYQTLDALDGKQARRTGSASPLGELFDHGCDSLTNSFVIVAASIALQLGTHPGIMFFMCFSSNFVFYAYHWQTYCTGVLQFNLLDVTEAQFIIMLMMIVSAVFGCEFWSYELKIVMVLCSCIGLVTTLNNLRQTLFVTGGVGKNQTTVANSSLLSPIIPIASASWLAYWGYSRSPSHLFETHPCLYALMFGIVSAKITDHLVVAHLTKSSLPLGDSILLAPLCLCANQWLARGGLVNEYVVLWICMVLIYVTQDLCKYCWAVCKQICDYLDIYCFKVSVYRPPVTSPPNATTNDTRKAAPPSKQQQQSRTSRQQNGSAVEKRAGKSARK